MCPLDSSWSVSCCLPGMGLQIQAPPAPGTPDASWPPPGALSAAAAIFPPSGDLSTARGEAWPETVTAGDPVQASRLDPGTERVLAQRLHSLGGCRGLGHGPSLRCLAEGGTLLSPRMGTPGACEGLHSPRGYPPVQGGDTQ